MDVDRVDGAALARTVLDSVSELPGKMPAEVG